MNLNLKTEKKSSSTTRFKFYELEVGSCVAWYGPRRSGKSTALISSILEREPDGLSFYDRHNKIFIFCLKSNEEFFAKYFPLKNIYVGMKMFEEIVPKIIHKLEHSKTRNCLIVIDDLLTSNTKHSKNNDQLNHIISTSRHYRMICVLLCQSRQHTNHLIRNLDVIAFSPHSVFQNDRIWYQKELLRGYMKGSAEDIEQFYNKIPKYTFIVIHLTADSDKTVYEYRANMKIL